MVAENLESSARSLLVLKDLENFFNHCLPGDDIEYQILALQSLRERFSELRLLCETEPGLLLQTVTIPKPKSVAKAKPTGAIMHGPSANLLGTLV